MAIVRVPANGVVEIFHRAGSVDLASFLPPPAQSTLVGGAGLLNGLPPSPRPAFTGAPAPPPCPFPPPPSPGSCRLLAPKPAGRMARRVEPGKLGEITLAPRRIIAPVGGQVVLQAGLCGNDGFYSKHERLRWTLAQDGVGQLVDVGPSAHGLHACVR